MTRVADRGRDRRGDGRRCVLEMLSADGYDDRFGLRLGDLLSAHGLRDVAGEMCAPVTDRDGFGEFLRLGVERLRVPLIESARLSETQAGRLPIRPRRSRRLGMAPPYVYIWAAGPPSQPWLRPHPRSIDHTRQPRSR